MEKQTLKYIITFIIGFTVVYGIGLVVERKSDKVQNTNIASFAEQNILSTTTEKEVSVPKIGDKNTAVDVNGNKYTIERVAIPEPQRPDLSHRPVITSITDEQAKSVLNKKFDDVVASINKDGKNYTNWIILGNIYKMSGEYSTAKNVYEYAKYLNPNDFVSYNNLGDLYHYYLKDYVSAEKNLETVIKINPKYIVGYINLSNLYKLSYQTDTNKAETVLKQGIATNPKAIDLVTALASYYESKKDFANAKIQYEKALVLAKELKNNQLVETLNSTIQNLPK